MMRKFGRFTGKMRAMAFEFKQGIDELGRQAELEELRKEVANLKAHTGLDDIKKELEEDRAAIEKDVNEVMKPVPAPVHPALGAAPAVTTEIKREPAPYAGLSPDHPGYDNGEGYSIGGDLNGAANGVNGSANGNGANGTHVNGGHEHEAAGAPYIIPDEEEPVKAVPVKQDTTV